MIEVSRLTKTYGSFYAVRDVSFRVGEGEVVGFLGPNGAGKSTTLRILSGFLGMTSGTVKVAGYDIAEQSLEARSRIGYMPQASPLYGEMRVAEYLRFRAELKGVPSRERKAAVDRAMAEVRVDELAETLISKLSHGYQQRVSLADALVSRPPLLVLDEPTSGFDPNERREVRELIKGLGERHTVLLSTHILSEVEATCSRAIVIARGKLVGEGTLDELRAKRRSAKARLVLRAPEGKGFDEVAKVVGKIAGVAKVAQSPEGKGLCSLDVTWSKKASDPSSLLEQVVKAVFDEGYAVREATPAKASLDEVFAELTEGDGAGEAADKASDDEVAA